MEKPRTKKNERVMARWTGRWRPTLYEAAQSILVRSVRWSWLKPWAMKIARYRGMKRAIVALARRLAVIMHRIYGPAVRCKGISNGMVILVRANLSVLTWELVLRAIIVVRTSFVG
jgi:hypothetical protein